MLNLKFKNILTLVIFQAFIFLMQQNLANAFFESHSMYLRDDNRPPFRNKYASPGKFYLGAGFTWARSKINDMRSTGLPKAANESLVASEKSYAGSLNEPTFDTATSSQTFGTVFIGYAPKSGMLSMTRHELEMGFGSNNQRLEHINAQNQLYVQANGVSNGYSNVNFDMRQRYLMYNLYLQAGMKSSFGFFVGSGAGIMLTSMKLVNASSGSSQADLYVSKNATSLMYSFFTGVTYDINSYLVAQGKIKYSVVRKPSHYLLGGSFDKIENCGTENCGSSKMMGIIGVDLSLMFGV